MSSTKVKDWVGLRLGRGLKLVEMNKISPVQMNQSCQINIKAEVVHLISLPQLTLPYPSLTKMESYATIRLVAIS